MTQKFVLPIVVLILVIAVAGYFLLDFSGSMNNPWKAIPSDAALIIEVDNPENLLEKLTAENEIWNSMNKSPKLKKITTDLSFLDSLLITLHKDQGSIKNYPLLFSVHPDVESEIPTLLFVSPINDKQLFNSLISVLEKNYNLLKVKDDRFHLQYANNKLTGTLYLAYEDGLLILSTGEELFKESLAALNNEGVHFSESDQFTRLNRTSGKKVDARIFIHYPYLSQLFQEFSTEEFSIQLDWIGDFADWTETDLMIKKDEFILTGFTMADTAGNQFLKKIADQTPVTHDVFNIIPFNTNLLLSIGFSNLQEYPFANDLNSLSDESKLDVSKLLDVIDQEIALVSNATTPGSIKRQSWFVARLSDLEKSKTNLKQMSTNAGSSSYSGYTFRQIKHKGLIPKIFGDAFSVIQNNWYTFVGNYIVFANSDDALINFIRFYETGKTLDLNENFKAFADNLSETYNILLLIKPRDLTGNLSLYFNKKTTKLFQDCDKTLQDFEGIAFQFSAGKPFFYTSFYLKNNKSYKDENLAQWKLELDDQIAGRPTLVKDHKTNKYNVLVFDKSANMYLISTDGRLLWKKRIDALPQSTIRQVDYYKNNKIQYLFNSADFIYLVDKNGNMVANYPKKLNPSSTNGLSVFDYNNKKDYRLVLAQSDKKIYNYNLKGSQIQGWSKPRTINIVTDPVTRLVANNKDYFIINDIDRNITVVNRRGSQRIKLKKNPDKASNSSFYVNQTNSKGIIITTNTSGKLTYISATGNLQYTDFGDYSPAHFFLYKDFNGDGTRDFIYIDQTKLSVFDRFKNVLFSYEFDTPISIKPEFISLGKKQQVLGVVADQEKTVYLFDKNGNTIISKGLIGETPFTVGSLQNNNEINLVTAVGKTLYNYRID